MNSKLAALMSYLGLSVPALADLAGVHVSTAYRWINGESRTPKAVIKMLETMVSAGGVG